ERRTADARGRRPDRFVQRCEPQPEAYGSRREKKHRSVRRLLGQRGHATGRQSRNPVKKRSRCSNKPIRNELRQQGKCVTDRPAPRAKGLCGGEVAYLVSPTHIGRASEALHSPNLRRLRENVPGDARPRSATGRGSTPAHIGSGLVRVEGRRRGAFP